MLTIEVEGKTLTFEWPTLLPAYPRKFSIKLSDFGIDSIESAMFAAEAQDAEAIAKLKLLQLVLVECMGKAKTKVHREVAGKKQYIEVLGPPNSGGKRKTILKPDWIDQAEYAVPEGGATTRLPNSVNRPAACIRDDVLNWELFKTLLPRLRFLDDTPNPEVSLSVNDEAQWKVGHAKAIDNKNPKRKAALELIALVKSGKYTMWNGRS